jgi:tetratricopeptide (TPR) repeat protein
MSPIAQAAARLVPFEAAPDAPPGAADRGTHGLLPLIVTQAMTSIGVGDLAGALTLIAPHASLAEGSLAGAYAFALIHMNAGGLDEALRWFEIALAHAPDHAPSLLGHAALLHRNGAHAPALDSLTILLRATPDNVEALTMCGAVLCSLRRSGDALRVYDEALRHQPQHAPALAGRGLLLEEQGATEAALADLEAARKLTPGNVALHAYCGRLLQRLGRQPAALGAFEAAIRNGGTTPDLFCAQGLLLQKLGRGSAALDAYNAGLARNPECAELHCNRGSALHALGDIDAALTAFDAALHVQPNLPQAALNRATLLLQTGQATAAIAACTAMSIDPVLSRSFPAEVACLHGAALHLDGRSTEALPLLEMALDLKPDYPEALLNRANALQDLGHLDAALAGYDAALARRPGYPEALSGRGVALKELGRGDEAMAAFDAALAIRPAFADARNNRAGLRLLRGDFIGGFADYESRWQRSNATPKAFVSNMPSWRGEPIAGRSILVFDEQGLGDLIQFSRYLPMLVGAGANVTFLCRSSMHWFVAGQSPALHIVHDVPADARFDFQCALMSLPLAFATRLETVPAAPTYVQPAAANVALWATRLGGVGKRRIGLCWHGNANVNLLRNVPLAQFGPLAQLPGIHLVSLVKDMSPTDVELCSALGIERPVAPFDDGPAAFVDTSAIMAHLDLIVTTDTAIAHLAGALGRPTFLLLKQTPDWRWLEARGDTPWYPAMRLFRQAGRGDWTAPIAAMVEAVAAFGKDDAAGRAPLSIPVAVGELVDKITILELKQAASTEGLARTNVTRELDALQAMRNEAGCDTPSILAVERELKAVNAALWDIEDEIRREDARGEFGSRFIELARAVYVTNDRRAALKRQINTLCNSAIVEEKFYAGP